MCKFHVVFENVSVRKSFFLNWDIVHQRAHFVISIFTKQVLVHKRVYLNDESIFTNSYIDRLIPTPVEMRIYPVHYRFRLLYFRNIYIK